MQRKRFLNSQQLHLTIERLCYELIENHDRFENTVLLGLQPKGVYFAERMKTKLEKVTHQSILLGYLDVTFHRDDFRRRDEPLSPKETKLPFVIEDRRVVLIDDVLYTGRSVRSAMDAMNAFGRPAKVEFLTLIDRMYSRQIPVEANYVGKYVNTIRSEKIQVELTEQGKAEDSIWLINPHKP